MNRVMMQCENKTKIEIEIEININQINSNQRFNVIISVDAFIAQIKHQTAKYSVII